MPRSKSTPPSTANFTDLEAHLSGTLRPVAPPMDIAQRLRSRIQMPEARLLAQRIASWRYFLIVVGGAMSAALLIIALARALFHLTGRRT